MLEKTSQLIFFLFIQLIYLFYYISNDIKSSFQIAENNLVDLIYSSTTYFDLLFKIVCITSLVLIYKNKSSD